MADTNHFVYLIEDGYNIIYNEIHLIDDLDNPNDHTIMAIKLIEPFHKTAEAYIVEIPNDLIPNLNPQEDIYKIEENEIGILSYIRSNGKPILQS